MRHLLSCSSDDPRKRRTRARRFLFQIWKNYSARIAYLAVNCTASPQTASYSTKRSSRWAAGRTSPSDTAQRAMITLLRFHRALRSLCSLLERRVLLRESRKEFCAFFVSQGFYRISYERFPQSWKPYHARASILLIRFSSVLRLSKSSSILRCTPSILLRNSKRVSSMSFFSSVRTSANSLFVTILSLINSTVSRTASCSFLVTIALLMDARELWCSFLVTIALLIELRVSRMLSIAPFFVFFTVFFIPTNTITSNQSFVLKIFLKSFFLQLRVFRGDIVRHFCFIGSDFGAHLALPCADYLCRENASVFRAIDGNCRHGDSRWHLNRREESVYTCGSFTHGYPDNGERGVRGNDTGKMSSHSSAANKHLIILRLAFLYIFDNRFGSPVRRHHMYFVPDSELF